MHLTSKPFFMSNGPKEKSFLGGGRETTATCTTTPLRPDPTPPLSPFISSNRPIQYSTLFVPPPLILSSFVLRHTYLSSGNMDCKDIRHMQLLTLAGGLLGVLGAAPVTSVFLLALFCSVIFSRLLSFTCLSRFCFVPLCSSVYCCVFFCSVMLLFY